jgi:beta-glucosidase
MWIGGLFDFQLLWLDMALPRFETAPALLAGVCLVFNTFNGITAENDCNCDAEKQPALVLAANDSSGTQTDKPVQASEKIPRNGDLPAYLDPNVPIEQRIDDLLPRLTLEEKVIQLSDSWGSQGIPRLKIPALLKTEGLHSQSYSSGATIFPVPIAMASTFDTDLINRVGKAIATEAKAANLRVTWSPVLDVARDARWGRVEETYGEDPFLVSRMGVAWITGFQSLGMIAVPKHFAGHGEPLGGRDSNDVGLSDRTMREVHLVPFRAAVEEAGAGGVMAAYSTWDGIPNNASTRLLKDILHDEWGFDGIIVSDCGGPENFLNKQSVVNNLAESCRLAILAGVSSECGDAFKKTLASTVRSGLLRESDLEPNLRSMLRAKFKLGLFENPGPQQMVWDKLPAYDVPERRALAREVAVESAVLLKNEGKLLPLGKDIKTIAVIGPNADQAQIGDYSPKPMTNQLVTVLQAVKAHVGPETKVLYAKGCDTHSSDASDTIKSAVEVARQADTVILVVGDHSYPDREKSTTGENNDGATLEIPGAQRELIKQIQSTGKPVVLVLVNGKPFTLAWEAKAIPVILETWYPGEEGGNAIADIIFGDRNPSGRLPITFPRSVGQLPLHYNYLPSGRGYDYYDMPFRPLYRFGYGLSYTSFKYSNLATRVNDDGTMTVLADIENTGDRDGDEVAQLYITDLTTSVITPVIELKGIKRVPLKKGEQKTVTFELTPYQLSFLDADMNRVVEPGRFRVHVGGASPEPPGGGDHHKTRIGFNNPSEGVSGAFDINKGFGADFSCSLAAPSKAETGKPFETVITITNGGNLLDVAIVRLYGDVLLDSHHFEIPPKSSRVYKFNATLTKAGPQNLSVILGEKVVSHPITVSKSRDSLALTDIQTKIDAGGTLHYWADASNMGAETYKKGVEIRVDGKVVATQPIEIESGAHKPIQLSYTFPHSGRFRVKVGGSPETQMVVPGGVSPKLQRSLIYLDFDKASASGVENQINGTILELQGHPQLVAGQNGKAFQTADQNTYLKSGGVDLYRK